MAHTLKRYWRHTAPQSPAGLVIYSGLCIRPLQQQCQKQKHSVLLQLQTKVGGICFQKKVHGQNPCQTLTSPENSQKLLVHASCRRHFFKCEKKHLFFTKKSRTCQHLPRRCNGNKFVHSSSYQSIVVGFFRGIEKLEQTYCTHFSRVPVSVFSRVLGVGLPLGSRPLLPSLSCIMSCNKHKC